MSQKDFHVAFIFRNQGHGILSSTYFNTPTVKPYPQTAILVGGENNQEPFYTLPVNINIKSNKLKNFS